MATRSRIGIELKDGKILTSYCHYDGGLASLGYNLVSNWMDYDKVLEAIQLGDASSWGQVIGEKHPSLFTMWTTRAWIPKRLTNCMTMSMDT